MLTSLLPLLLAKTTGTKTCFEKSENGTRSQCENFTSFFINSNL